MSGFSGGFAGRSVRAGVHLDCCEMDLLAKRTCFANRYVFFVFRFLFSVIRCRLSASPATGLLGMQENVFLNDYFGCLGLLPLASER